MSTKTSRKIFKTFRVLLLKTESDPDLPVLAICLDQNLVGRGPDQVRALADLETTLMTSLLYGIENLLPDPPSDPDPDLLRVFEKREPKTTTGETFLDALLMRITYWLEPLPKTTARRKPERRPEISYEGAST